MVALVKARTKDYPEILLPILDAMGHIANACDQVFQNAQSLEALYTQLNVFLTY